jgi:hypothetical protein
MTIIIPLALATFIKWTLPVILWVIACMNAGEEMDGFARCVIFTIIMILYYIGAFIYFT